MNLTRIFDIDYFKAYGPQAILIGIAAGLGTYSLGSRMTYRELQDSIDDIATVALYDNIKDFFAATAGTNSKLNGIGAVLIPVMGRLGNTVAEFVVKPPTGVSVDDPIQGSSLFWASLGSGVLTFFGVYITAEGIAATIAPDARSRVPLRS